MSLSDAVPCHYSNPFAPALVGLAAVSAFLLFFVAWGFLAPVSGAAIAEGNLQVETQRQSVQHPYGGVVNKLLVREGQRVVKGETLLVLADAEPRAKLDVLVAQRNALWAQNGRLIAERDGLETPAFSKELLEQNDAAARQTMANEAAVMAARKQQFNAESGMLHAKVRQLQEQIAGATAQVEGLERQRALIEEEAKGARELLEKGFTPKIRVLALERTEAQLDADRGAKLSERGANEQAIAEARLSIARLQRTRVSEITDELRKAQSSLAELGPKIDAARDVLDRTRVAAPASGSVVGLAVFTEGGVIQPGARVLDIIPSNDPLIVDARMQLSDINEVKPGAAADVRLTGVARNERPRLRGEVLTVSADKLTDDRSGKGYYSLRVKLDPDDVRASRVPLQAGMPTEAIVTTRPRTLVNYLFGPLIDELTGAFREK
jgi:membrane fusion protein, type I secretion system